MARGVEREPLAVLGERGLRLVHRRPGPHGEHQLARLVVHDSAVPADRQGFPRRCTAEESLAAAALDA